MAYSWTRSIFGKKTHKRISKMAQGAKSNCVAMKYVHICIVTAKKEPGKGGSEPKRIVGYLNLFLLIFHLRI